MCWRNQGFETFEDFTATLRSSKRKKLNRERRKVLEAGIEFQVRTGSELTDNDWNYLFRFYCNPYHVRGRMPYLSQDFFRELSRVLGDNLVAFIAHHEEHPVASAILLRDQSRLYGRYWGSDKEYDSLHFETCYYRGIEYAISEGLTHFEPGTQGEHKLIRGFHPTRSFSAHWIAHPDFANAISEYLEKEKTWVDDYVQQCGAHLPFKRG
ncbi:MAG: GNAT family N-acetyltransferase [Pseudomonadota bacterium]